MAPKRELRPGGKKLKEWDEEKRDKKKRHALRLQSVAEMTVNDGRKAAPGIAPTVFPDGSFLVPAPRRRSAPASGSCREAASEPAAPAAASRGRLARTERAKVKATSVVEVVVEGAVGRRQKLCRDTARRADQLLKDRPFQSVSSAHSPAFHGEMASSGRFRIGPDHYGYDYQPLVGVQLGGFPVYRCVRGKDDDPARLLHLYFDVETSLWHAVSVGRTVTCGYDVLESGAPAFRAVVPHEDVRRPGAHQWQCYDAGQQIWWPASSFRTTEL